MLSYVGPNVSNPIPHATAQKRERISVDMSTDALLNSNAGDGAVVH